MQLGQLFLLSRQGPEAYKPACIKCKELLSLGGRTVIEYDCFPAEMMHKTIRKLKEDKVEMVMKNELENGIDKYTFRVGQK